MNGQYKHDVFISFSFADQAIVETVANLLLSKHGITYWVCTQDIYGGEHYKEAIVDAIEAAKIFLLIQSESSVSSTEVPKEVDVALSCHKTVVPFVIDRSILMGDLRYDLSGIHRIDASRPTLEDRVAELAKHLHVLLKHPASAPTLRSGQGIATERLRSTPNVLPKKVFYGRDTVLDEIKGRFDAGERVLFLQGIGGIGKTQIVKQFAQRHQKDYDTIVYATYNGSLKELVLSDTYFDLEPEMNRRVLADGSLESDDDFFYRKLGKIKKLADERTLIIIDNFDVEGDESLATMMEGRYHLLFTTRCDFSRVYPAVKISAIDSMDHLVRIFMDNYDGYDVGEDDPDLISLIELVNRHTYTIELLAQHMENSGQTAKEMQQALEKEGIISLNETVRQTDATTKVAYENLLKMFKVFSLSLEEQTVLRYLSLMPLGGFPVKEFRDWAGLESYKLIKGLEARSWVTVNTDGIALHPIIREVVRHELPADLENCHDFLERILERILETNSWHFTMAEREKYAAVATELVGHFTEITEETIDLYRKAETLFSFSVKPQEAITLAKRIYEYYKKTEGEIAYNTGWAAFKIGWAYHFNSRLENAFENARIWLEKAYEIWNQVDMDTAAKNAFLGQMLGNLSRVLLLRNEETGDPKDVEDAKKYAELGLEVNAKWLKPGDPSYTKVAGGYIQMADVYIALKEYEKAMKMIDDAYDILFPLYGEEDSDTLYVLSRKERILFGMENYEEAARLGETVTRLYDLFCSELHYPRYEHLLLLLKCYVKLGRKEDAERIYQYLCGIAKQLFDDGAIQWQRLHEAWEAGR